MRKKNIKVIRKRGESCRTRKRPGMGREISVVGE